MSIVAIHQPNFLPFYGYFSKIAGCDQFVFLDDVQYEKGSYTNRVKIFDRSKNEGAWLTCQLSNFRFGQNIDEVLIEPSFQWKTKHLKSLQLNYKKARYFDQIFGLLEKVYRKEHSRLVDFNLDLLFCISDYLGVPRSKFHRSSEFHLSSKSNQRLIEICKLLGCDTYLHGKGAVKYHDPHLFEEHDIRLTPVDHNIVYSQFGEGFIPYLSVIDLLFHHGKESIQILKVK
ncbi:MAG: WbqC family protein [Bacteroidetes bacterium]|nr:WbqC family protein [Bacteroidota bacterium]